MCVCVCDVYSLTWVHDIAIMEQTFNVTHKMLTWFVFGIENLQVNCFGMHYFDQTFIVHVNVELLQLRISEIYTNVRSMLCNRAEWQIILWCVQTSFRKGKRPNSNSNISFNFCGVKLLWKNEMYPWNGFANAASN